MLIFLPKEGGPVGVFLSSLPINLPITKAPCFSSPHSPYFSARLMTLFGNCHISLLPPKNLIFLPSLSNRRPICLGSFYLGKLLAVCSDSWDHCPVSAISVYWTFYVFPASGAPFCRNPNPPIQCAVPRAGPFPDVKESMDILIDSSSCNLR